MFRRARAIIAVLPAGLDAPALERVSAAAGGIHDIDVQPAVEQMSELEPALSDTPSGGILLLDDDLVPDRASMPVLPPRWLLCVIVGPGRREIPNWLSEEAFVCLSRPLDEDVLRETLERGKAYLRAIDAQLRLDRLFESVSKGIRDVGAESRYVVSEDQKRIRLIRVEDIRWIEAAGNYMRVHTADGSLLVRATMKSLASKLGDRFLRIHRSHLVNRRFVKELRPVRDGAYDVLLEDGTRVRMSRSYSDALDEILARGI